MTGQVDVRITDTQAVLFVAGIMLLLQRVELWKTKRQVASYRKTVESLAIIMKQVKKDG